MNLLTHTGGFVGTNGFIIAKEDDTCIVIDAPAGIADFIRENSLTPSHLLLTHQHFDHVDDVAALRQAGARVLAFQNYAPEIIMEKEFRELGIPVDIPPYKIDELIAGNDHLEIAGYQFNVAHVPGHSPDSLSFHLVSESFLFVGDTLFSGSTGRSDLPGGNHQQLLDSIRENLYILPDETAVFPGHGPQTTIGSEKKTNTFCPQL